jgi:hypothetical protein
MASQVLAGYGIYLLTIFLPGLGLGELIGKWPNESSLVERIAIVFGLGLTVDTVVMFFKTSGVIFLGQRLLGVDLQTVYFVLVLGFALLIVSIAIRRKFSMYVRPQRIDIVIFGVILALGAILASYFAKYPIFPEYQSPDFANHLIYSAGLIHGTSTSIPIGILYYGVEYQLATALLLIGGPTLVTARQTMALLVLLSPLLFYLASSSLFKNRLASVISTSVYAFSASLWFDSVFNTGLFANFFGFLACLFAIAAFMLVGTTKSLSSWAIYIAALLLMYVSHYSVLTLLPALMLVAVVEYVADGRRNGSFLLPAGVALLPVAAVVVLYPHYVQSIISVAFNGGGSVVGGTFLSGILSEPPVIRYLIVEVYDDVAFIVFAILCAIFTYKTISGKNWMLLLPVIWTIVILVASPENESAWRFSFEALLPLILMTGQAMVFLFPRDLASVLTVRKREGRPSTKMRRRGSWLLATVLLGMLIVGSWGTMVISDSFTGTQTVSTSQNYVYSSIQWLGNNTRSNSTYLSVSDWRFTYTNLMIGRNTTYQFESTPGEAISVARSQGASYIIVTNLVTVSLPAIPSLYPWNNFGPSSNLTLVYSNPDVEIFKLA